MWEWLSTLLRWLAKPLGFLYRWANVGADVATDGGMGSLVFVAQVIAALLVQGWVIDHLPMSFVHAVMKLSGPMPDCVKAYLTRNGFSAHPLAKWDAYLRRRNLTRLLLAAVFYGIRCALVPVHICVQAATDPCVSRFFAFGVVVPIMLTGGAWAALKAATARGWLPWAADDDSAARRTLTVAIVTTAALATVGGALATSAPAALRWVSGSPLCVPNAFVPAVVTACAVAFVLSALHADGNVPPPDTADQTSAQSAKASDPSPMQVQVQYVAICCLVLLCLLVIFPHFNRKEFALLRQH
jgi:hypothetical protein